MIRYWQSDERYYLYRTVGAGPREYWTAQDLSLNEAPGFTPSWEPVTCVSDATRTLHEVSADFASEKYPGSTTIAPPPPQLVEEVVNEVVSLSGVSQTRDEANPKDLIGETKPPLWLVPPALEIFVSKVMELGARKYGAYNWRAKKVKAMVYVSAARRHLLQWQDGEDNDPESGQCHIAHAAACCGILLDAMATGNLIDDRPTKGAAAKLIAQFTHKK